MILQIYWSRSTFLILHDAFPNKSKLVSSIDWWSCLDGQPHKYILESANQYLPLLSQSYLKSNLRAALQPASLFLYSEENRVRPNILFCQIEKKKDSIQTVDWFIPKVWLSVRYLIACVQIWKWLLNWSKTKPLRSDYFGHKQSKILQIPTFFLAKSHQNCIVAKNLQTRCTVLSW